MRRAISRERLFGNDLVEPLTNFYRWDPDKNAVRWAWVYHPKYQADIPRYLALQGWEHLEVHHLKSRRDVAAFLDDVRASAQ